MPTVVLSNHPGYGAFSGERISAAMLGQMLDSLDANGWLESIDAVLTGYLPATEHVAAAKAAVARVRAENPAALYVCDPVFGDEPGGLYLDEATAEAIGRAPDPAVRRGDAEPVRARVARGRGGERPRQRLRRRPPARRPARARDLRPGAR